MEFTIDDLNRIIMNLTNEPVVQSQTHVTSSSSASVTAIKQEPSSSKEEKEQTFTTTTHNMTDRQYYLIVFNNPRWSQRLQNRPAPVVYNSDSAQND